MSGEGRRRAQLHLAGMHAYVGAVPTPTGYRARCACGWKSSKRNQPRTKRAAQGLHRVHATTEVQGHGV